MICTMELRTVSFHEIIYFSRVCGIVLPPNHGMDVEGHTSVVGDVAWHPCNPKLLGSVGDDKQLLFWDTSTDGSKPTTVVPEV